MKALPIRVLVIVACLGLAYLFVGCDTKNVSNDASIPVAALTATPTTGTAVLHVALDASASAVTGGTITQYEWDFDSDGAYDYTSTTEDTTDFYYYTPGTYTVTVRVTSSTGYTDVTSETIEVTAGTTWQLSTPVAGRGVTMANVFDVGGNPALVFVEPGDGSEYYSRLLYMRASDATGAAWDAEVELHQLTDFKETFVSFALFFLGGNPAIIFATNYISASGGQTSCWATYATEATGTAWSAPVATGAMGALVGMPVDLSGRTGFVAANTGVGGPYCRYCVAADTTGDTWNTPTEFDDSRGWYPSLKVIDGRPAFSLSMDLTEPLGLYYLRASDEYGAQWPTTLTAVDTTIDTEENTYPLGQSMVMAGTVPAIAYTNGNQQQLRFVRASDATGSAWGTSEVLAASAGSASATLLDGRPIVVYLNTDLTESHFIAANNAAGTSWGFAVAIENTEYVPGSLTAIGNNLAYCYHLDDGSGGGDVRLAMLR